MPRITGTAEQVAAESLKLQPHLRLAIREDGQAIAAWDESLGRYVTVGAKIDGAWKSIELSQPADMQKQHAMYVANFSRETPWGIWSDLRDEKITPEQAYETAITACEKRIAWAGRWIEHLNNRLAYERAMLAESGGTVADRKGPEKGGACRCWASPMGGWSYIAKVNKVSVTVPDNWGNGGPNFTRTIPFDKLTAIMSAAEVEEARAAGRLAETPDKTGFLLAAQPAAVPA